MFSCSRGVFARPVPPGSATDSASTDRQGSRSWSAAAAEHSVAGVVVCAHERRESEFMARMEPFLPIKHTGSNEIDAADPGQGAPATDPGPVPGEDAAPEMAQREKDELEKRMSEKRSEETVFRTPEVDTSE